MVDGVVRWPDRPATQGRVAVVTVSYNTRELTALMLWSLRRILEWKSLEVIVVDNGSTDGSAELLTKVEAAGGCRLIANASNIMHGPALTQAMSFLASTGSGLPRWVWVLDSDVGVRRHRTPFLRMGSRPPRAALRSRRGRRRQAQRADESLP